MILTAFKRHSVRTGITDTVVPCITATSLKRQPKEPLQYGHPVNTARWDGSDRISGGSTANVAKLNLGEVKLETMLASRLMREPGASQGFAGARHFYRSPVEVKPVAS